ncbi:hypothetical protein FNV43_RR04735 [Rhamnella rubrinervis]|uniref:Pentatricopeptide repeat-containing protein n=1 Tax=Rhamnella rubrinervis TaxID=2594499 RepID=A0A8K0HMI6_9ROSA|nr:hypothetical protein FNV43_RR04735 [Rhamnella rubrinervis]
MLSFEAPKIRLLHSLSIEIEKMQVLDFCVFPKPEYDVPIFCANSFTSGNANKILLDLNPFHDIISQRNYKEKYYKGLMPLGVKYAEAWLQLMKEAAEEADPSGLNCNCEAQHRYLTWRAEKDPGHRVLKKLIGETQTKKLLRNFLFNGIDKLGSKSFLDYFPEYRCEDGTIDRDDTYSPSKIVAFHMGKEKFSVPFYSASSWSMSSRVGLVELRGCLAVFNYPSMEYPDVERWLTKDHGKKEWQKYKNEKLKAYEKPRHVYKDNDDKLRVRTIHCGKIKGGKQLHGLVLNYGLETDVVVGSAMLDMYSKYGQMEDAITIFRMMPEKDTISWNGIICGYAQNGEATKALKLFDEMVHLESPTVSPNDFAFIGVLSACSHNGLLKEAYGYFNDMIHKYMIEPKIEYYTWVE